MLNYHSVSDHELIDLLKSGNHLAFTEIFNRYWQKMYIHALKMLDDEDEAKDLIQELFTSMWTKHDELDIQINLSGYLYVTTRNKVLNFIRHKKKKNSFEESLILYIQNNEHSIIEQISEKELANALEMEIQNLPSKMREVFELSRKAHLSHKEIGITLHISDLTVKKQINNALKLIRLRLNSSKHLVFIFAYFLK